MQKPSITTLHESSSLQPNDLITRIWQELVRAQHDRHHSWRTPVLATQGLDGFPQARTVVLRQADIANWTLTAFTDTRSPKCAELSSQPQAQLVFWSTRLNWQLRVCAKTTVYTQGERVDAAWERVRQSKAAGDYLSTAAPGSFINKKLNTQPITVNRFSSTHHLGILSFDIQSMDWLALERTGHQRARITPEGKVTSCTP